MLQDCINVEDNLGNTPLYTVAQAGCWEGVEMLLKEGEKINMEHIDTSASLRLAVFQNDVDLVKALLKKGVEVDIDDWINNRNFAGESALSRAVKQSNREIIPLLVHYGAQCAYETEISTWWHRSLYDNSPVVLAREVGGEGMRKWLLYLSNKPKLKTDQKSEEARVQRFSGKIVTQWLKDCLSPDVAAPADFLSPDEWSNLPTDPISQDKTGFGGLLGGLKRLWRKVCTFFSGGYFEYKKKEEGNIRMALRNWEQRSGTGGCLPSLH